MPNITRAECPQCGALCDPCAGCAGYTVPKPVRPPAPPISLEITQMQREQWRNTLHLHCPACIIGQKCDACGKDFSRGC